MMRSTVAAILITNLIACASGPPEHREFVGVGSAQELRQYFGEPDAISKFTHSPDVTSQAALRQSGLRVTHYERWVYSSTSRTQRAGSAYGKTLIILRASNSGSKYFVESISWLSDLQYEKFVGASS